MERIGRERSRREKTRASFLCDQIMDVWGLLEEKGLCKSLKGELEDFISDLLGDSQMECPLRSPGHVSHRPVPSSISNTLPLCIQGLVTKYFDDFHICYSTQTGTTGWHQLEKGIAMGHSNSNLLFTTDFETILFCRGTDGLRSQVPI